MSAGYRLQQTVLASEHGFGGRTRAGAGVALQHRVNLRGQCEQIVQRRVLHGKVIKPVAHGLGGMGFCTRTHHNHRGHALQCFQQVKCRTVHHALGSQHDVGPTLRQLLTGLRQRHRHLHLPSRPRVDQRIHHGLRMVVVTFDQQD
ncbi:hypothetical protein D3C87_1490230 [compost metagenome]